MPQGRGQTPEDMEQLAVFLATRANMTGQCVNVDGSMVSHWAAVSSRHGGELAFSKGQAPGLALGLRNAFAALPASSTASTRADEIARRRPIPPIPPTLLNLQGISAVSKKLGSVGGVGGANAAFAVGAPAGTALYAGYGFAAIALTSTLIPLVTLLLVAPLRSIAPPPHAQTRAAFTRIVGIVWVPGLGLALSGVGFGAITTFIVLLFAQHGWGQAWFAFTALSIAFMAGRLIFGHLPDKIGGARVALVCVLIEAVGQALIWLAPSSALALVGVMLTVSATRSYTPVLAWKRSVTRHRRAAASPWEPTPPFSICRWDSPALALGLVASGADLGAVYLVSTLVVLCAAVIAVRLLNCAVAPNGTQESRL